MLALQQITILVIPFIVWWAAAQQKNIPLRIIGRILLIPCIFLYFWIYIPLLLIKNIVLHVTEGK